MRLKAQRSTLHILGSMCCTHTYLANLLYRLPGWQLRWTESDHESDRWKHFCSDWSNSACSCCADVTCPAETREPQRGFSTPSHGPAWTTVIIQGWPQSCSFVGLAAPETDKKIKLRLWAVSPLNLKPGNSWASEVSDDTEICHSSALASGITDCKYCIAYILDFFNCILMFYFSLFTTVIFAFG